MPNPKAGLLAATLLVLALSGCGSSDGGSGAAGSGSSAGDIAGKSTDVTLVSNVDGSAIAFTVHEPTRMTAGGKYPLILQSHGFGGSRENAAARGAFSADLYQRLIDQGYGLISIDERGHGDSGGKIRVLDPDYEGKDLLQILDWAEDNLPWLAYRNGNLVLGATGGSYGGGYQHLIYAIDPKHRLDAIVPEITWHDLRFSLDSGDVFKAFWGTLLSAAGNAAGNSSKGNFDPIITEGLAQGLATSQLPQDKQDVLYNNSLVSYCEGNNTHGSLTRIDALYWQSPYDTLFNLTDAYNNYACVKAKGGDVRILTKLSGHDSLVGGPTGEACGKLGKDNSILAWFDQKLKGVAHAADYIPAVCFNLDDSSTDGVVMSRFPVGGQSFQVPAQTMVALEGSPQTASIMLTKIGADGAVLAGIPTIQLKVSDPSGINPLGPVIYVGLAKRAAGASTDTLLASNELRPFRGFGEFDNQLIGVSSRLAKDDELRLVIQASHPARYPAMSSKVATPLSVEATVQVPLLSADLPAAPEK